MPSMTENTMPATTITDFDTVMAELEADFDSKTCPALVRSKSCNALYVESSNYYNFEHVSEESFRHQHPDFEGDSDDESEGEPESEMSTKKPAARASCMEAIREETASDLKSGATATAAAAGHTTPEKKSPQFADLLHTLPTKKTEESALNHVLGNSNNFKAPSPPTQMQAQQGNEQGSGSAVMSPIRMTPGMITKQLSNVSLSGVPGISNTVSQDNLINAFSSLQMNSAQLNPMQQLMMQHSAGASVNNLPPLNINQMAATPAFPSTNVQALLSPQHVSQGYNAGAAPFNGSSTSLNTSQMSVLTPTGNLPPLDMGRPSNLPTPTLQNMSSPELAHLTGGRTSDMGASPYAMIPGAHPMPSPGFNVSQRHPMGPRASTSENKKGQKSEQHLDRGMMKKLNGIIRPETLPITGPKGQNFGTQGEPMLPGQNSAPPSRKGSEMSSINFAGKGQIATPAAADVSTTITPRSEVASDPFMAGKGAGKATEAGLMAHEFAQAQGHDKDLKRAAVMTYNAEGTHMPTSFRQGAMGDVIASDASGFTGPNGENLTFLEERKRHFSRQKQQAVFHYTLRHAKQYSKQIGMTIEWCFRQLEEKRKLDLMRGIRNPVAELAQKEEYQMFTQDQLKTHKKYQEERSVLEAQKKASEIDFLTRQKDLADALGMGEISSCHTTDPSSRDQGSMYGNFPSSSQHMPASDPFTAGRQHQQQQPASSASHYTHHQPASRVSNMDQMQSTYTNSVTHSQMYGMESMYTNDSMSVFYDQHPYGGKGMPQSDYQHLSGYQYM